jgi:hypothetical protein
MGSSGDADWKSQIGFRCLILSFLVLFPLYLREASLHMTLDEISAMPRHNYFTWKHPEENYQSDSCNSIWLTNVGIIDSDRSGLKKHSSLFTGSF